MAKYVNLIVLKYCGWDIDDIGEISLNEMCRLYNFDEKDTSRLVISYYLHNIGLLEVDKSILKKPEKLTKNEYFLIKSAPYNTKQILSKVFGFDDISKLASLVYERIDGSGYPFMLDGSELGLKNRVLSVIVIASALKQNRDYRKSFENKEMMVLLKEMSSDGFLDKSVVEDFISCSN
jgi:HD-GYP domain-containing protein (c-di-GMP phosphodiesterase class II)